MSIIVPSASGVSGSPDLVSAVLLPNADRDLPGGEHPDGSRAVRHYGGIAVIDTNAAVIRFQTDLFHHDVEILDDTNGECTAGPSLTAVPDLCSMVNDRGVNSIRVREGAELEGRVAANIVFRGGALGTWGESVTPTLYSYPMARGGELPPAPMASYLEWRPQGAVRIRIREVGGSGWTEMFLSGDEVILIYNWDIKHPTLKDFKPIAPPSHAAGQVIVDTDFKWLYQLLMPPDDDWKTWLKGTASNALPAPELRCDEGTAAKMKQLVDDFEKSLPPHPTVAGFLLSPPTGILCGCCRWVRH